MGVSKIRGHNIDPNNRKGLLLSGHPHEGAPAYRNRHVALIRIDSKLALYQLQTSSKEHQTPF